MELQSPGNLLRVSLFFDDQLCTIFFRATTDRNTVPCMQGLIPLQDGQGDYYARTESEPLDS